MGIRVVDTDLMIRAIKRLRGAGYEDLDEVAAVSKADLLEINGFGLTCLDDLERVLKQHGLSLRPEPAVNAEPSAETMRAMAKTGMRKAEIARRLGCSRALVYYKLGEKAKHQPPLRTTFNRSLDRLRNTWMTAAAVREVLAINGYALNKLTEKDGVHWVEIDGIRLYFRPSVDGYRKRNQK